MNFFANLAVFGHAQRFPNQPLEMKTMAIGKTSATYLESAALPPGVQPAYALREGFLLVSSSPEWIRRFAAPTARSAPDAPAPLLRVSFKAWRGYIQSQRPLLAKAIAQKENLTEKAAAEQLISAVEILEFLDQLDVRLTTARGQAIVSIVLRPAQPLKK